MIETLHLHDHPLAPHDLWGAWSWEPFVMTGLAASGLLYLAGMRRLRRRCRTRGQARRWEAVAFWLGWAVLALSLLSPLHRLGETLLSAHMAQHELLMVAAAPLLVLGRPLLVSLWALPIRWRRRVGAWAGRWRRLWHALSSVEIAWLLHAIAIVVWHVPSLYQRTVDSPLLHSLQHSSFLVTGFLFWWSVLPVAVQRGRYGSAILSLFSTMVYTGGIGALLTLARIPWFPRYAEGPALWGLTPLEDQQLAGLIMWVPGGIGYLLASLWLMTRWLRASDAAVVRGITAPAEASSHIHS